MNFSRSSNLIKNCSLSNTAIVSSFAKKGEKFKLDDRYGSSPNSKLYFTSDLRIIALKTALFDCTSLTLDDGREFAIKSLTNKKGITLSQVGQMK